MPNCDDNVVQDLYMLLPTDKWTLFLAGIPELLLWIIFLCIPLAVCLSEIIASENELYLPCVYCVSVLIFILSKNLFLEFLLTSLVIQHCLWLTVLYAAHSSDHTMVPGATFCCIIGSSVAAVLQQNGLVRHE